MDRISPEKRSWNMSRVKGKDTSIELVVRKELFRRGYRFRKNVKDLPGHPDIVLPKYSTVIFVNGCFWHRHSGCKLASTPKNNAEFWERKFQINVENDLKAILSLELLGWNVIVVWECEIKKDLEETVDRIVKELE